MDAHDFPANGKVYRLPKHYLVLGIVCSIFFALMGIVSSVAALLNVDGSFRYPVPTAIVFGCFWSAFTLLGVWLILAYYRESLHVSEEIVRSRTCLRTCEVQLSEVVRATWKSLSKGGGIVLCDLTGKVTIHFGNFTRAEQTELIEFFRKMLKQEVQESWGRFEAYCVPQSASYLQRHERDRRRSYVVMPLLGVFLLALSIWDP